MKKFIYFSLALLLACATFISCNLGHNSSEANLVLNLTRQEIPESKHSRTITSYNLETIPQTDWTFTFYENNDGTKGQKVSPNVVNEETHAYQLAEGNYIVVAENQLDDNNNCLYGEASFTIVTNENSTVTVEVGLKKTPEGTGTATINAAFGEEILGQLPDDLTAVSYVLKSLTKDTDEEYSLSTDGTVTDGVFTLTTAEPIPSDYYELTVTYVMEEIEDGETYPITYKVVLSDNTVEINDDKESTGTVTAKLYGRVLEYYVTSYESNGNGLVIGAEINLTDLLKKLTADDRWIETTVYTSIGREGINIIDVSYANSIHEYQTIYFKDEPESEVYLSITKNEGSKATVTGYEQLSEMENVKLSFVNENKTLDQESIIYQGYAPTWFDIYDNVTLEIQNCESDNLVFEITKQTESGEYETYGEEQCEYYKTVPFAKLDKYYKVEFSFGGHAISIQNNEDGTYSLFYATPSDGNITPVVVPDFTIQATNDGNAIDLESPAFYDGNTFIFTAIPDNEATFAEETTFIWKVNNKIVEETTETLTIDSKVFSKASAALIIDGLNNIECIADNANKKSASFTFRLTNTLSFLYLFAPEKYSSKIQTQITTAPIYDIAGGIEHFTPDAKILKYTFKDKDTVIFLSNKDYTPVLYEYDLTNPVSFEELSSITTIEDIGDFNYYSNMCSMAYDKVTNSVFLTKYSEYGGEVSLIKIDLENPAATPTKHLITKTHKDYNPNEDDWIETDNSISIYGIWANDNKVVLNYDLYKTETEKHPVFGEDGSLQYYDEDTRTEYKENAIYMVDFSSETPVESKITTNLEQYLKDVGLDLGTTDESKPLYALKITDFYKSEDYLYFLLNDSLTSLYFSDLEAGYFNARGGIGRFKLNANSEITGIDASYGLLGWTNRKDTSALNVHIKNCYDYDTNSSFDKNVVFDVYRPEVPSTSFTGFFGPQKIIAIKKDNEIIIQDYGIYNISTDPKNGTATDNSGFVTVDLSEKTATYTKAHIRLTNSLGGSGFHFRMEDE